MTETSTDPRFSTVARLLQRPPIEDIDFSDLTKVHPSAIYEELGRRLMEQDNTEDTLRLYRYIGQYIDCLIDNGTELEMQLAELRDPS